MKIYKSNKLHNVRYDIRGIIFEEARKIENKGEKVFKLNIGNPAIFGFHTPKQITEQIILNYNKAEGYIDSKGIITARKAIENYYQKFNILNTNIDDIYIGNGVSELIVMVTQALLNPLDEILIPSPDYPLWTAASKLAGGKPVHYKCNEKNGWEPDIEDITQQISKKTKAIVIINPNNPTGAVYSKTTLIKIVEIAKKHNLIILSDEIYDKILYDEAKHIPIASLTEDILCITFNGLSKSYLACGFRCGWMIISGNKDIAKDFIKGLEVLSNMRLCSNVPSQFGIEIALNGYQDINDLVLPKGRLLEQRNLSYEVIQNSKNLESHKPKGALYNFVKIKKTIENDEKFVLDLLKTHKILVAHGTAFNWENSNYFRIVTLANKEDLVYSLETIDKFINNYKQ